MRRLLDWFTITKVGVLALALGLLAAILEHADAGPGARIGDFFNDFYRSNAGELLGIGFTVLILDQLYKRKEERERKASLVKALGSPERLTALTALESLRTDGWIDDGTLRTAELPGARLAGADLRRADLAGANLVGADLTRAQLDEADLSGADLTDADLTAARLAGANLEAASLAGARLSAADLTGARGADLAVAGALLDATLPDGARYDGRFDLAGDRAAATTMGFAPGDPTAMARFYAVPRERYEASRS